MSSSALTEVFVILAGGLFGVSSKVLCFFSNKLKYFAEAVCNEEGVLTSPNFGYNDYPNNLNNNQTIKVEGGKAIKIHFTHWDVDQSPGGICDYVTITEGDGSTLADIRPKTPEFGLGDIAEEFVSKTDTVHVLFNTDENGQRPGWRLIWGESISALFLLNLTEIFSRSC